MEFKGFNVKCNCTNYTLFYVPSQGGQVNITPKTGHSLDAYAFGMFVSDILDTRADLGNHCSL